MELTMEKARRIAENIKKVAEERNIDLLNKRGYQFITMKMGFIAHYDLHGFREVYRDLRKFFLRLQTSEYSNDNEHNLRSADREENDLDFRKWYGEDSQKSTAWAIREIVTVAREYEKEIGEVFGEREKAAELRYAEELASKYGYSLIRGGESR